MSDTREPPGPNAMRLIAVTFVWTGTALAAAALLWTRGEAKGHALQAQILAGVPLAYWGMLLVREREIAWGRRETIWLLLCATALRLILLPLAPAQSDDVYRYVWEGRVQLAGMNPYQHAPLAEALAHLRDADWSRINHPQYSAIYPPLAQAAFLSLAAIRPGVLTFKLFFTLCDLGVLALVLLRGRGRDRLPAAAAVWAFHPLVICEFSGNGHLDSFMILALVLSLHLLDRGMEARAVLALTAAVAIKLIPVLIAPYFVWRMKRPHILVLVPALVALSYLPYAGAGPEGLFASLRVYEREWLYNAPLFDLARDHLLNEDGFLARRWYYILLAAVGAGLWFRRRSPQDAALPVFGFYHAAGPVIHPWYLTLEAAVTGSGRRAIPWLWLTLLAPLAYLGEDQPGTARWIVRAVVWGPFYVGVIALALTGIFSAGPRKEKGVS